MIPGPNLRRGFDHGMPDWRGQWQPLDDDCGWRRTDAASDLEVYIVDRLETGRPIRAEVVA